MASIYENLFEQKEVLTKGSVEFGKIVLVESGMLDFGPIQNPLMIGIRNLLSTDMIRSQESSTWNPESMVWNPESKTVLDSLTWCDKERVQLSQDLFGTPT